MTAREKDTTNPLTVIAVFENELNALLRYDDRLTRFTPRRTKPNVCYFDHKDHLCSCQNWRWRGRQRSWNGWSTRRANVHAGSGNGSWRQTICRLFSHNVNTAATPHIGARWTYGSGRWQTTARQTNCIYRWLRTRSNRSRQILWKTVTIGK